MTSDKKDVIVVRSWSEFLVEVKKKEFGSNTLIVFDERETEKVNEIGVDISSVNASIGLLEINLHCLKRYKSYLMMQRNVQRAKVMPPCFVGWRPETHFIGHPTATEFYGMSIEGAIKYYNKEEKDEVNKV